MFSFISHSSIRSVLVKLLVLPLGLLMSEYCFKPRFSLSRLSALLLTATLSLPVYAANVTVKFIHTDAQGTPIVATDKEGNVIERYEYEPYGLQISGPVADGPGYTGHVEDTATGLTYMQQRYLDPRIGAFLSVDPVTAYSNPVGSFNRYRYANNNPYKFVDPDGRAIDTLWDAGNVVYDLGKAGYGALTDNDAMVQEGLTDAALDGTAMLIPFVPAGVTKLGRVGEEVLDSANDAVKLNKKLASEQQMGELVEGGGVVTHGAGTNKPLSQAKRLAAEHGGEAGNYQKVSSSAYKATDGGHVETHAYRNTESGEIVEPKTIIDPTKE